MRGFLPLTLVLVLSVLCVRAQVESEGKGSVEYDGVPRPRPRPRLSGTVIQPNGLFAMGSLKRSCRDIKRADRRAPSGEYFIQPNRRSRKVVKAYCEMGLHGGGYTFLHPTALTQMTDAQLQAIFTDRRSFLMRYRESTGRQPYSVLQQLPHHRRRRLKLGLNQNRGYKNPVNKGNLGSPYLYFGFIPARLARSRTTQGLRVNGRRVTFRNCDRNPNSYIALFPNFAERRPSTYGRGVFKGFAGSVCTKIANLKRHTPSSRAMPVDYFMFTEAHFGGCGCYGSTGYRSGSPLATTIGFR